MTSEQLKDNMMKLMRERAKCDLELKEKYGIPFPKIGPCGTLQDSPRKNASIDCTPCCFKQKAFVLKLDIHETLTFNLHL